MRYFGRHHLAAELGHDVFDTEIASLAAIPVAPERAHAIAAIVERTFAAMWWLGWQMLECAAASNAHEAAGEGEQS